LAENESARQVMGEPALRVIATELVKSIKSNVSMDRILRDAARAQVKSARKLQRPQTVVLPPQKPPIPDSTKAVRPERTEGQSAPSQPVPPRLPSRWPEAPPPGRFSR
jgi:hypothetical protein